MENLIKMDDLGVPLFLETLIYSVLNIYRKTHAEKKHRLVKRPPYLGFEILILFP